MNGILLIDKPSGWTSHDVVAKVRSLLRTEFKISNSKFKISSAKLKVGHTGTLDPFATGLLILVVGSYTKKAAEFSKLDKTYEAELTLGATSSTGDIEGKITPFRVVPYRSRPSEDRVRTVIRQFEGQIMQTPHQYSAVKVGGQRAYRLARKGLTPKLETRKVKVYSIQLTAYSYPKLKITTEVSSGTYIRSLAEDIGEKLGTGAYLSSLRRTKVGKFGLKNALEIEELSLLSLQNRLQK